MGLKYSARLIPHMAALSALFVLISCPFSSFATAAERASAARDVLMSDGAERLSKDWKQCRSSDLEVVSNASAGQMKEVVATLSAFRAALAEKFPTLRFTSPVPTVVVLFKNDAAFTPYKPRDGDGRIRSNVAGYFYAGASRNYIVLPAVGQGSLPSLQVILHEYVHSVLSRNSVEWPLWLEEGLADLYSTFEYDAVKGLGTVGIAPAQRIDTLRRFPLLPIDRLLGGDSATLSRSQKDGAVAYGQMWAMVHYLMLGRPTRRDDEIQNYLAALAKGSTVEQAFTSAFNTNVAAFAKELEKYVAQPALPGFYVTVPPSVAGGGRVESLTEAERLFVQADLLSNLRAENEAERIVEKLLAAEPNDGDGRVLLGEIRARQKRFAEAQELLSPVASGSNPTFRSSLSLCTVYLDLQRNEDALNACRQATTLNGAASAGWLHRSVSALAAGRASEAEESMTHLRALEPTPRWYYERAKQAFHRKQFASVTADATAYLDKAGVGPDSAPYAAFLGAIAHWHLGQPDEATRLLERVGRALTPDSWVGRVTAFMEDRLSADALLNAAGDTDNRTEAHAYIGVKSLFAGRKDDAVRHLRWVVERGAKTYTEYRLAESELRWWLGDTPPSRK